MSDMSSAQGCKVFSLLMVEPLITVFAFKSSIDAFSLCLLSMSSSALSKLSLSAIFSGLLLLAS